MLFLRKFQISEFEIAFEIGINFQFTYSNMNIEVLNVKKLHRKFSLLSVTIEFAFSRLCAALFTFNIHVAACKFEILARELGLI